MSYFDERQSDLIQKANYYNEQKKYGYNQYETTDRNRIKSINLTPDELDHIVYKACYSAQSGLLNVLLPRLKELDKKQTALFSVLDKLVEDNRDLMKQNEVIQRQLKK